MSFRHQISVIVNFPIRIGILNQNARIIFISEIFFFGVSNDNVQT